MMTFMMIMWFLSCILLGVVVGLVLRHYFPPEDMRWRTWLINKLGGN